MMNKQTLRSLGRKTSLRLYLIAFLYVLVAMATSSHAQTREARDGAKREPQQSAVTFFGLSGSAKQIPQQRTANRCIEIDKDGIISIREGGVSGDCCGGGTQTIAGPKTFSSGEIGHPISDWRILASTDTLTNSTIKTAGYRDVCPERARIGQIYRCFDSVFIFLGGDVPVWGELRCIGPDGPDDALCKAAFLAVQRPPRRKRRR